jgi:hypothetical protein
MTKRGYGDGGIDERGENVFRLRYRVGGKRFAKPFTAREPKRAKSFAGWCDRAMQASTSRRTR